MLQAIERYMKQAIVDKVPSVSSSALVSSLVCSTLGGWAADWETEEISVLVFSRTKRVSVSPDLRVPPTFLVKHAGELLTHLLG